MPGRALSPEKQAEALVMREAGYTIAVIAQRLGASISTLQRLFKRTSTAKGKIPEKAVQQARESLLQGLANTDELREEFVRGVIDDIAHSAMIRERAAQALEVMRPANIDEAALMLRGLTAYSTILKNTADTRRSNLKVMGLADHDAEGALPELIIREMTADEVEDERERQASDKSNVGD